MDYPSFISAYPIADTLPDGYLFIPKEECLFSRQHFSWIGQMPDVGHL